MSCGFCDKDAVYKCAVCSELLCAEHTKMRTVCLQCEVKEDLEFTVDKVASKEERKEIHSFVRRFWGEQEQLTFDRSFVVSELPAYAAKEKNRLVGFVSLAEAGDSIVIVALGVAPQYQRLGVGKELLKRVEHEASQMRKKRLLVSTSNDDLPALAFYQSVGFQIYEVRPNVIAQKHGKVLEGLGKLPIRDELRLQKVLS